LQSEQQLRKKPPTLESLRKELPQPELPRTDSPTGISGVFQSLSSLLRRK
jgi:hypothetical protein